MKKVKVSHKGRKCRYAHCSNILSIYNHEIYCHIHMGHSHDKRIIKVLKHDDT